MRSAASLLISGALGLALAFGLAGCKPEQGSAASVDAQAMLPTGALAKDRYARSYLLADVKSTEDTPYFTTSEDFDLAEPRRVWVAVYVLPEPLLETERPGIQVHTRAEQMPMVFHGGCGVVNLVADARSGETLASWCNVESTPPDGPLQRIPRFRNASSPFP
jgi:hypothetical protein